jgi:hypothetical protein
MKLGNLQRSSALALFDDRNYTGGPLRIWLRAVNRVVVKIFCAIPVLVMFLLASWKVRRLGNRLRMRA